MYNFGYSSDFFVHLRLSIIKYIWVALHITPMSQVKLALNAFGQGYYFFFCSLVYCSLANKMISCSHL